MWVKRGLIYKPDGNEWWAQKGAISPKAILLGNIIRLFIGCTDGQGRSRIRAVDVAADNPGQLVHVSQVPVLDIGRPGCFDDNGVLPGFPMQMDTAGNHIRLIYHGFQIPKKCKFLSFSGVADSHDGGLSFTRLRTTPLIDRSDESTTIRVINNVVVEAGQIRYFYICGEGWEIIRNLPYPRYHIRTQLLPLGNLHGDTAFLPEGKVVIKPNRNLGEYRVDSLSVYQREGSWHALCTIGATSGTYLAYCLTSTDGVSWQRQGLWLPPSGKPGDWDSESVCYPYVIKVGDRLLAFYNGNDMGHGGLGWAEWVG